MTSVWSRDRDTGDMSESRSMFGREIFSFWPVDYEKTTNLYFL